MAMRKPEADDTLSRMHRQHAKDKENDRVETGSFPVVARKPKRTSSLDANRSKARLPIGRASCRERVYLSV